MIFPTTWEEFFALGDAAKADGVALFTFPQSGYLDATIYSMLAQAGGTEFLSESNQIRQRYMDILNQ